MVLCNNLLSRWSDYYVTSPYNINIHIVQRTRDQNGQIDQPAAFIFILLQILLLLTKEM